MTTESQIRKMLANPYDLNWSIQGFGMLRAWLDPDGIERLHIWDTDLANPEVSTIHNHPWDFESRIIFGGLKNQRYQIDSPGEMPGSMAYRKAEILTGTGGGLLKPESAPTIIAPYEAEVYSISETYQQYAEEFHESEPDKGTVTIIRRNFRHNRIATVCWPNGSKWVTAEPRAATKAEIDRFISLVKAITNI